MGEERIDGAAPDVKSTAKPAMTKGTKSTAKPAMTKGAKPAMTKGTKFGQVCYVKAQQENTIAEAFPAAAFPHLPASHLRTLHANDPTFGDVASFRMAIRTGMFPRGWKDIPEEKRKLPFVFRAALEEALLNGLGPLELDEVRRMAVEYGDACVFHKAILGGLFPGGWKDIPEEERKVHSSAGLRAKCASVALPGNFASDSAVVTIGVIQVVTIGVIMHIVLDRRAPHCELVCDRSHLPLWPFANAGGDTCRAI